MEYFIEYLNEREFWKPIQDVVSEKYKFHSKDFNIQDLYI